MHTVAAVFYMVPRHLLLPLAGGMFVAIALVVLIALLILHKR